MPGFGLFYNAVVHGQRGLRTTVWEVVKVLSEDKIPGLHGRIGPGEVVAVPGIHCVCNVAHYCCTAAQQLSIKKYFLLANP
jgi:hypothetical protein